MNLVEYCGSIEFSILEFVFSTTHEVKEEISQKKLFYKEQIIRFIQKKMDRFFRGFTLNKALLQVYRNETFNTIMFKLQPTLKTQIIFRCA